MLTAHIPSPSHGDENLRAVPLYLQLGRRQRCTRIRFGLTWAPDVAIVDPVTPVTFEACPAMERLLGSLDLAEHVLTVEAGRRGHLGIEIDLSVLPEPAVFPPFFEQVICYVYFKGKSNKNGKSCTLEITGFEPGEEPSVVLDTGEVRPFTVKGTLQIRAPAPTGK